jgi:glycosyltransferase involved in cell wall biosynthesis
MTIKNVVEDCKEFFPEARVIVFDNGSTDQTYLEAKSAGAEVIFSPLPGKGSVIKHFFKEVHADTYIVMDGDGTYPAKEMRRMYDEFLITKADMVVGNRIAQNLSSSFPRFHFLGNRFFTMLISCFFSQSVSDVLSGGRILTKQFVDQLQLKYKGFEVEVEMTIKAIIKNGRIVSVPIQYNKRKLFSKSKLKTWDDGFKILLATMSLFKEHRPKAFFGFISFILVFLSIFLISISTIYCFD